MCGRFVQYADPEWYASHYAATLALPIATGAPADSPDAVPGDAPRHAVGNWRPSYNVTPSRPVLALRVGSDGGRELTALRWGLIPGWSKGPDHRYSMINARAETVASKPAYRAAFKHRRCLIPAEGFYEWRTEGRAKQPYFIHRRDGAPMLFAGLWEQWQPPDGAPVLSCTIIVTAASRVIAPIHDRMPVVISAGAIAAWLDPAYSDSDGLQTLLRPPADPDQAPPPPPPADWDWMLHPVSPRVNSPRNDDPGLLEPLAASADTQSAG